MTKKYILFTFIVFLIIIVSHYRIYRKINNKLEIITISNKLKNYDDYISENLPIVFKNNNNIKNYIISPLTIKTKNINILDDHNYCYHNNNMLLIEFEKKTSIFLLKPDQKKFFSNIKKKDLKFLKLKKNRNYKYIQLNLSKDDILCIPRFWIFKFNESIKSVKITSYDTIFTLLYKFFY